MPRVPYNSVGGFSTGLTMTGVIDSTGNITGVGATFSGLIRANAGISAAGGVTFAGTFSGTTGSFSRLTTFDTGLSGNINISSTNVTGNVMYLLMARGTGVTGVFIDNVSTPLIYNPFLGNLGLKGITLSSGADTLTISPTQITAINTTNNAYFYFIANGGNYLQSPVISQIGDIGAVNSAMTLSVDPSTRVMTWSDGVLYTGVTSGFFGVNRSPAGMLSDYAVEINSPTGKGIQLMYNDYTGAVSNSVKMDVSSAGNYTVLPSGGLATITGTLNVSAGISASGATFSGNVDLQDNTLSRIELLDYCERYVDLGDFISKGSQIAIDMSTGQVFRTKITAGCAGLNVTNVPDNGNANAVGFSLLFVGDGTARTMTWNIGSTAAAWAGGIAPTYTSTLNKTDIYSFLSRDGGSNWFAFVGGQNF